MLYRRLAVDSTFHHLNWGLQGSLVMAKYDGSHAVELGGPGTTVGFVESGRSQIACLYKDGIKIHDVETGSVVGKMPRKASTNNFSGPRTAPCVRPGESTRRCLGRRAN